MKKGILCILLSLLLVTPLFVGCNQNNGNIGTEAIVYTLYTICEEGTTEEAITQVELALNRLLFYRLNGIMVKLEMVTEDEYDELIAEKYEEVNEYQEKVMNGDLVPEEGEFFTGDDVLKKLENGEEIPLDEPRLDIFLVRGYDEYLNYVNNKDVQELDTVLENYGKALKSNIHGTLFKAAQINNKTYGIPVNHAIDQYTYLIFDNDYLTEGFNPGSVSSLNDLEDYLQSVKETSSDVVPLKDAIASDTIFHLLYEGSPFLANNTSAIKEAYKDEDLKKYFALIAKYNQLGYLGSEDDPEGTKYAVRFEKGKLDELKSAYPEEDYKIVKFAAPIATSHSVFSTDPASVGNLFCISKFVASNDISNVMSLLNALNTDPSLMNILLYGVENEHYILTEKGQIKRESEDYIIDPNNIGNAFIARTLYDENDPDEEKTVNTWLEATQQNSETTASYALGFAPAYTEFSYIEDGKTIDITEPDYIAAIKEVTDKYYKKLLAGEIEFDYETIYNENKTTIFNKVETDLKTHYESEVLRPIFENEVRNSDEIIQLLPQLKEKAREEWFAEELADIKSRYEGDYYLEYQTEHPSATHEEIEAYVATIVTDEFVEKKLYEENDAKTIEYFVNSKYDGYVDSKVEEKVNLIAATPRYTNMKAQLLASERYADDLKAKLMIAEQKDIPDAVTKEIVKAIDEQIITPMNNEIETAIKTAIDNFFEEHKDHLGYETIESLYIDIEYYVDKTPEQPEDSDEPIEPVFGTDYKTWFEFVYTKKIAEPFKTMKEAVA